MRSPAAASLISIPVISSRFDARCYARALLRLLNRPPFAMGPIIYPREDGWAVTPDQMTLPL